MEANVSYTLIATTYYGRNTGDYTLVVSGVGPVTLVRTMEPTTTGEYHYNAEREIRYRSSEIH